MTDTTAGSPTTESTEPTGSTGAPTTTRQWVLASRPEGYPEPGNFRLETVELPAPGEGQILVRTTAMSVDPYMRGRMNDVKSYVPPFRVDGPLEGGAVGVVEASRSDRFAVGDHVLHGLGWRDHAVLDASAATPVDVDAAPETAYLGILGMTGLTAYTGLTRIGGVREGDTVFISGAAGAVGSAAGQMAKLLGASRVIGSAGTPEKVARLRELGFDAAFDYHDGVLDQLRAAAPDGIDLYFDNVGGEHLEAALDVINPLGRVAVCGIISAYNDPDATPAPRNMSALIAKNLTVRGFVMKYHWDLGPEFRERMSAWLRDGEVRYDETVREGLESAPQAFIDLLHGANTGKMVVRL